MADKPVEYHAIGDPPKEVLDVVQKLYATVVKKEPTVQLQNWVFQVLEENNRSWNALPAWMRRPEFSKWDYGAMPQNTNKADVVVQRRSEPRMCNGVRPGHMAPQTDEYGVCPCAACCHVAREQAQLKAVADAHLAGFAAGQKQMQAAILRNVRALMSRNNDFVPEILDAIRNIKTQEG